jgi:hypothetical protein
MTLKNLRFWWIAILGVGLGGGRAIADELDRNSVMGSVELFAETPGKNLGGTRGYRVRVRSADRPRWIRSVRSAEFHLAPGMVNTGGTRVGANLYGGAIAIGMELRGAGEGSRMVPFFELRGVLGLDYLAQAASPVESAGSWIAPSVGAAMALGFQVRLSRGFSLLVQIECRDTRSPGLGGQPWFRSDTIGFGSGVSF